MKIDDSIVQLGTELDEWFDSNRATFASQDREAQGKSLTRGFEITKELDRLKADGLAAITALVNRHGPVASEERIASLVRGFEFAAKLADTLHDELLDTDGGNKATALMDDIAAALDSMGAGRVSLAVLLHSPDVGVRASAGAYLIKLMPDRVLPILREIEEGEGAVVLVSMRIGRFSAGSKRTKCAASRLFQNLIFIVGSAAKAREIQREMFVSSSALG